MTERKTARRHGPNREAALVATVQRGRPYETPNVLTEALGDKIAKYVKMGDRPFVAAELCAVPRRTHYEWIEHGEADKLDALDTIYARYAHKIEAAESYAEHMAVMAIRAAWGTRSIEQEQGVTKIPGDPKAALAWLARRRDGWQERRELTGAGGTPLFGASGFEGATDEEIEDRLNGLRKRRRSPGRAARTPASPRTRAKARTP